ncbi:Putative hydroxypyruvate reductase [Ralstonia mannitolilytica]|nr:Putative hydroxypyruvate reductase [Ralstonia mannitolilytica]
MHHDQSAQAALRAALPNPSPRALLHGLFDTAVAAVSAAQCLPAFLPEPPRGRTIVIGAGKGAAAMAEAVEQHWKGELSGLVVTRYEHGRAPGTQGRIEVVEASHPVPDAAGQRAAQRMVGLLEGLTEDDLVLCLISGGGSALLAAPAEGLTLADKQSVNRALLKSGASIGEMNCVRKHLSSIKGGRLALACAPARVETLLISDIPGDDPTLIASGPTLPDATTCADALAVIDKYGIDVPEAVRRHLESGAGETPKPGDARFKGHRSHVIATAQHALEAAAAQARALGYEAHILSDSIEGEARDVAEVHAGIVRQIVARNQPFTKPCVILSGGETTVTVRGNGAPSRLVWNGPPDDVSLGGCKNNSSPRLWG